VRRQSALAVDDSLSARRSLAQFVQDTGLEVRTARDGLEAIEIINRKRPDIVLADLEMPRMNGLELAAHLRANQTTHDLPVIMITSRSTDKHRREAERWASMST
jgi:CheY-like chemotaxis protein